MAQPVEQDAYGTMEDAWSSFRKGGIPLPSRFEVVIYPPPSLKGGGAGKIPDAAAKDTGLRCQSISLPGRNLTTSPDANMYGVQPDIVDGVTFAGTATMVFTSSQNMAERNLFQTWQGAAWNSKTWNIGYYKEYIGSVDIFLLDAGFKRTYGVKLMECYPKEIMGNDFSAAPASGAVGLKLTIQMQYKYWEELKIPRIP